MKLVTIAVAVALAGCATHHDPRQSWDQANLKRNDKGCPTAIYIAPEGNLVQCQMTRQVVPEPAVPAPEPSPTLFNSMEEAAVHAEQLSYNATSAYELGGVITEVNGKFAIGLPRTDFSGDSLSQIDMDPIHYHGTIVANYHTHPCLPHTHDPSVFSPEDLRSDRSYKSIGFVANFCTGKVMKYDPSKDVLPDNSRTKGWAGTQVGTITVTGQVLDSETLAGLMFLGEGGI